MKKTLLFLLTWAAIASQVPAQLLSTAWTFPDFPDILGYDGNKPTTEICHNFLDMVNQYGDIPSLQQSGNTYTINDDQVNKVLAKMETLYDPNELQILYFPPGAYNMTDRIILNTNRRNIVLRGEGSARTIFYWRGGGSDFISINGSLKSTTTSCWGSRSGTAIYLNGTNSDFGNPSNGIPEYALINQDNLPGTECIQSTRLRRYTGQVCRVTGKSWTGDRLYIAHRLRKDFSTAGPLVRELTPAYNNGVECLKIDGRYATGDVNQFTHVRFNNAVNCWITSVESYKPKAQHMQAARSSNLTVNGCYFHEAFDYGSGGHGYGVNLNTSTGECLIENNVFRNLRHSMMAQIGANGNGFMYNYSREANSNNVDLLLHGRWPFSNLFEGNVVERIEADQYHGRNGDRNIIFRNRTTEGRIKANNGNYWWVKDCVTGTNNLGIVGNNVDNNIRLDGSGHSVYDNQKNGSNHGNGYGDNGDNTPIGNSYFYPARPSWFPSSQGSWPALGPGNAAGDMIPARFRWNNFSNKTTGGDCLACKAAEPLRVTTWIDPCVSDGFGHNFPGYLNLTITGGTPPYSTVWQVLGGPALGFTTTNYASYYGPGAYRATVTDGAGSTQSVTFYPGPCEGGFMKTGDVEGQEAQADLIPFSTRVFPNPFDTYSQLKVHVPKAGKVEVVIFSMNGQILTTLPIPAELSAGDHLFDLPVEQMSQGIYFCRVVFGSEVQTLKLIAK